jgi:hypothetical protein
LREVMFKTPGHGSRPRKEQRGLDEQVEVKVVGRGSAQCANRGDLGPDPTERTRWPDSRRQKKTR